MSEMGGWPSLGKGKGEDKLQYSKDVKVEPSISHLHNTRRNHIMDTERIRLDGSPGMNLSLPNQLSRSWDWIDSHCGRRHDLIPLQCRILSEAISKLGEKSDDGPLHNWTLGISTFRERRNRPPPRGWREWIFGASRSQQQLLLAQYDQIMQWHEDLTDYLDQEGKLQPESAIAWKSAIVKHMKQEVDRRGRGDSKEQVYIVVALRSKASNDPEEKLLKIEQKSDIFKDLRKGINSLRGWRGFFSLKSLKAFGLSKVSRWKH